MQLMCHPGTLLCALTKETAISVDVCVSGGKANTYNPRRNQISTTHRFNTPPPPPLLMVFLLVSLETEILNTKTQLQWQKEQKRDGNKPTAWE